MADPNFETRLSLDPTFKASVKTRLLLDLWSLTQEEEKVKRSALIEKLKRKKEKTSDYAPILEELAEAGSVEIIKAGRAEMVSITEKGLQELADGLKNPEFEFDGTIIGTRVANSLLDWIRQGQGVVIASASPITDKKIGDYEEFKTTALEVYDKLNREFNYDDLVPIYRLRRTIGDRVSRSEFNEWLLEMQANDVLQLMESSVEDGAPDKIEDSITTESGSLRCYAKKLI